MQYLIWLISQPDIPHDLFRLLTVMAVKVAEDGSDIFTVPHIADLIQTSPDITALLLADAKNRRLITTDLLPKGRIAIQLHRPGTDPIDPAVMESTI